MFPEQISSINGLGLAFLLCMGTLLLFLPRRLALFPVAATTCYMTFGQQIVVVGLHFTMLRMLVLMACARVIFRNETRSFKWLRIDTAILLWVASSVTTYTLLWQSSEALVNRLGLAYDAVGFYFVFRFLIRDIEDFKRCCRVFAVLLFPLAISMCVEKATGQNPFYLFGGVPPVTEIRDGVLRCQGPFGHPILAGTFGAVWLPLFLGLWYQGRGNRSIAALGMVSSTAITLLSGSSGPVAAYFAGIVGLCMWPLRNYMRTVRWGIVLSLGVLQLVMKAPVWFIFAHLNLFSGSTGWHRANLIDLTIRHFFDWWLLGTRNTLGWGVWAGDITNQFISQAVRGGLSTLVLFVYIIVLAYSGLGRSLRSARFESRRARKLLWALGCTLLAHIVGFLNVSYFDQNVVNWYLLLALIATAVSLCRREATTAKVRPQLSTTGPGTADIIVPIYAPPHSSQC